MLFKETEDANKIETQDLIKQGFAIKKQIERLTSELDKIKFRVISQACLEKKEDCNTVNLVQGQMTAKVVFKENLSLKKEALKQSPELLSQFCNHKWQIDKKAYLQALESEIGDTIAELVEVKHAKPSVSFDTVEDVAMIGFVE